MYYYRLCQEYQISPCPPEKWEKQNLQFEHDSSFKDFFYRFLNTHNQDLTTRLDYYSAVIREEMGRIELDSDVSA